MKSFKAILILLIVLIATISAHKRKNSMRRTSKNDGLSTIMHSKKVDKSKIASYTTLARTAKASCQKHCFSYKETFGCLSADCFICECLTDYSYSKDGGNWSKDKIPQAEFKKLAKSNDCYIVDL